MSLYNSFKKGLKKAAGTVIKSIPGVTEALISLKVELEEGTKSYHGIKNQAIKAIEQVKNINNNPHVIRGFENTPKDQWCEDIRFAQNMTLLIDGGRTFPPLDEDNNKYKEFKRLIFDDKVNRACRFKGGKFYKLKVKRISKTQKQSRNSKKYKGKSKTFKSKKLGK